MADEDTLRELQTKITDRAHKVRRNDGYYDGEKRLQALGLSLPPEMRALQTVINWPRLVVDALEERIDLTGFRLFGSDIADDRLWAWWQANNLDEESSLQHLEAFVQGRAFVTVGYDEDNPDTPIITCESGRNMTAKVDPRTRRVMSALRLYDHNDGGDAQAATLYLPDRNVFYKRDRGEWRIDPDLGVDDHNYGKCTVVPFVNRARLADRDGRSEMDDTIDITDAACRNLTNLQGAQELMALPSRYVFGISEDEMKKPDGSPVTKWEAYLGRYNALGDPEAKVVQLPAAELRNFTETLNSYAKMLASVTGLPAHYLAQTAENPASADAIRSGEARHVKRAERKCKVVGGAWEEVMRLAMLVVDGDVPDTAKRMEALFADCATPTYAAKVDGVVKLSDAGLLPDEMAWEELGWSPQKVARAAEMKANDPMSRLAASVGAGTGGDAAVSTRGEPVANGGLLERLGGSATDGVTP